jgi:predicted nucleic acid-binding protein
LMSFVLDSSVALAWLLPDEDNDRADTVADRLEQVDATVPSIWPLEVGNGLLMARRRGRISEPEFARCVAAVSALPIQVDVDASRLGEVLSIAQRQGLTSYDAAYLELCLRRQLPLATLDERLRQAAGKLDVAVIP